MTLQLQDVGDEERHGESHQHEECACDCQGWRIARDRNAGSGIRSGLKKAHSSQLPLPRSSSVALRKETATVSQKSLEEEAGNLEGVATAL